MRVLFWNFHCPSFICFCKSSPLSLSTPCTLELENTQPVCSISPARPDAAGQLSDEKTAVEKFEVDDGVVREVEIEVPPRSSLKKRLGPGSKETEKVKVQWMDFLGKELVEIQEFEPSESGESEDGVNGNHRCVCAIQ